MNTFSTVFVALMALLSTAMALYANRAQQLCHQQAQRFNAMRGRLIALEGAHESLLLQHQRLAGRFHAAQRMDSETPPSADVGTAPAGLRTPAPYCDNWATAQREGPMSPAGRCDCGYCSEMRFRRDQLKLDLLPAARTATLGAPRTRE